MELQVLSARGRPAAGRELPYLFAYQPIFDRDGTVVAQELLYRQGRSRSACIGDPMAASATVIVNAFTCVGSTRFLRRRRAFINIDEELLLSDLVTLLPRDLVVIELLETVPISGRVVRRCQQLRALGYTIALDDLHSIADHEAILDAVDLVKVDLRLIAAADLPALVATLKRWPLRLLAEKIESAEEWRQCAALGFDLFQGYHLARPMPVAGIQPPLSLRGIVALIELLDAAAPAAAVARALAQEVNLRLHLLRLANSPVFPAASGVASLTRALELIGRAPLRRWCRLLLCALRGEAVDRVLRHARCGGTGARAMVLANHVEGRFG